MRHLRRVLCGAMWLPALAAVGLVRLYQVTLSHVVGRACRFVPTCSEYTAQALLRHGLFRGAWMGAKRIARCNPWGGSGHDPVP